MDDSGALRLVVSELGADELRLDELSRSLRRELLDAGAAQVVAESAGPPPEGARGLDVVSVGALLTSVGAASLTLTQAIEIVRGWLGRRSADATVVIEREGRSVTLTGGTVREQSRLVGETLRALGAEPAPSDGC